MTEPDAGAGIPPRRARRRGLRRWVSGWGRLAPRDALSDSELEAGLSDLVRDGMYAQMVGSLTSGVVLVAYALALGASNFAIGLLAALPFLAQLAQIPAIALVERLRMRRAISVSCLAASRLMLLPLALLPLLEDRMLALASLVLGTAASAALGAVAACSWNSWIRQLVPERRLGVFFARRQFMATAAGMAAGLGAGLFIDGWAAWSPARPAYAFSLLFLLGLAAGAASTWYLARVPEPRMEATERRLTFATALQQPFRDGNFKRLIIFLTTWNFAVNLAAPFFTVYMVQELQLSLAFVTLLLVSSQGANLLVLNLWGRLSDRMSNKSVLAISAPAFLVCILSWILLATPKPHSLTLPLLIAIHLVMGMATAGITLASGNIGLKLAPRGQATAYLAASSLFSSMAAGMAPILGGLLADDLASRRLLVTVQWTSPAAVLELFTLTLRHWDFFFLSAFVLGLYALHRLALVREEGEVEERLAVRELVMEARRSIRNLSSVGGLRVATMFPFGLAIRHLPSRRPSSPNSDERRPAEEDSTPGAR